MKRAEDCEEEDNFYDKVSKQEGVEIMIGRITELVVVIKHPNAGDHKPEESDRAKDAERQYDGQGPIVIVAHQFKPFQPPPNLLVFGAAKAIAFADQQILRYLWRDVPPQLQSPLGRALGINFHNWINLEERHERKRALKRQRQMARKNGYQTPAQ